MDTTQYPHNIHTIPKLQTELQTEPQMKSVTAPKTMHVSPFAVNHTTSASSDNADIGKKVTNLSDKKEGHGEVIIIKNQQKASNVGAIVSDYCIEQHGNVIESMNQDHESKETPDGRDVRHVDTDYQNSGGSSSLVEVNQLVTRRH